MRLTDLELNCTVPNRTVSRTSPRLLSLTPFGGQYYRETRAGQPPSARCQRIVVVRTDSLV